MKKHYDGLLEAMTSNQLIVVYREKVDENRLDGYVIGLSETWVLLHTVDGDFAALSSYEAVRLADVSRFRVSESFMNEYLCLRGISAVKVPQIEVQDLQSLLLTVSKNFPMFMIECERIEPGIGFIGHLEKLTKRSLFLKKFNSKAKWINTEKFKLKDITKVSFEGGYIQALVWMDTHNKQQTEAEPPH